MDPPIHTHTETHIYVLILLQRLMQTHYMYDRTHTHTHNPTYTHICVPIFLQEPTYIHVPLLIRTPHINNPPHTVPTYTLVAMWRVLTHTYITNPPLTPVSHPHSLFSTVCEGKGTASEFLVRLECCTQETSILIKRINRKYTVKPRRFTKC